MSGTDSAISPATVLCHLLTKQQSYSLAFSSPVLLLLLMLVYNMLHSSQCLYCLYSHPGYFGKVGMRHFHLTKQRYWCPTINLDKLWSLVSEQTRQAYRGREDKAPVIDVTQAVSFIIIFMYAQVCLYSLLYTSCMLYL